MVTDLLENAHLYKGLSPRIAAAFDWATRTDLKSLDAGRHEIDGSSIYAIVSNYVPKAETAGKWEAHQRYLDLQVIASGTERIGVAPIGRLIAGDYIAEKDIAWLQGTGDFVTLAAGQFMLLWPGDAHMPGIETGFVGPVHKVVVKIAVEG